MRRTICGWRSAIQPRVKKVALHAVIGEELQHLLGVALDPAGKVRPIRAADLAGEGLDLEIILDVDGHRVADWGSSVRVNLCFVPTLTDHPPF